MILIKGQDTINKSKYLLFFGACNNRHLLFMARKATVIKEYIPE